MAKTIWITLVSAAVGAAAALGTLALATSDRASAKPQTSLYKEESSNAPPAASGFTTVVIRQDSEQLQALQQDVERLRKERRSVDGQPPPSPEEERREIERKYAKLEQLYTQDPVDPKWSSSATRDLSNGLQALGQSAGFSVKSAECKTTRCQAIVEWKDKSSARKKSHELAERGFPGLNCAQSTRLKDSNNGQEPYTSELYLDCTRQRAGLVEAVAAQ